MNTSSEHLPKRAKTAALRQVQVCFHSAKTMEFLKGNKLIKSEKDGKEIFYSLADEHVKDIFEKGLEHLEELNL